MNATCYFQPYGHRSMYGVIWASELIMGDQFDVGTWIRTKTIATWGKSCTSTTRCGRPISKENDGRSREVTIIWCHVANDSTILINLSDSFMYWSCFVGRDLVMVSGMTSQKLDNQLKPATYVMWFGGVSVSNLFFKWSPVASDNWLQVVSRMSQSLALVRPPTSHVCMLIIIGKSNLVTCPLFLGLIILHGISSRFLKWIGFLISSWNLGGKIHTIGARKNIARCPLARAVFNNAKLPWKSSPGDYSLRDLCNWSIFQKLLNQKSYAL